MDFSVARMSFLPSRVLGDISL